MSASAAAVLATRVVQEKPTTGDGIASTARLQLPKLSLQELQSLTKLLGSSSYGTKETLVVRLNPAAAMALKLAYPSSAAIKN
jgi:hypothetical protein